MAKKIVIASGKGGVGKSTVAALLSRRLAKQSKKTLLVDCDAGLNSMDLLLEDATGVFYNWLDAARGDCSFPQAAAEIYPCLSLLCAPSELPGDVSDDCLKTLLAPEEDDYDFIILDAPAGLGHGLKRAALAADTALIIATADEVSVRGAERTDEILCGWGITQCRLIVNRYELKAAQKGRFLSVDSVIDRTYVQLIGVIPEDPALRSLSVLRHLSSKSKSVAAAERIAARLQGRNVPLSVALLK